MESEIWKDVVNHKGSYQVSNLGNVKSLDRKVNSRCGKRTTKGVILKQMINISSGYYHVNLYKNCKLKTRYIHQLLAESFLNHKPNGHNLVVNHINFNKLDNNLRNLEIISHRENSNLKHIKSSSKYVGVYWDKGTKKWKSKIGFNGIRKHLGSFINEYDAHLAYQKELKSLWLLQKRLKMN